MKKTIPYSSDTKFIHISPIYNRDSIFKYGIIPTKINLDHHLTYLQKYRMLGDDENKIIYLWESCNNDEKYIKDLIYCKTWLHPRNKFINENDEFDFSTIINKHLYDYTKMIFDIYEITKINLLNTIDIVHEQKSNNLKHSSLFGFNDRYSHDDKKLSFSKSPERNFKIISQCEFETTKYSTNIKLINVKY